MNESNADAAQIGKMFVTHISFDWNEGGQDYNQTTGKYDQRQGAWKIAATLRDKPTRYGDSQTMTFSVEQGIGQKLVEVLLPVVVADASKKAQQMADDSKAMIAALNERTQLCIADMPIPTA